MSTLPNATGILVSDLLTRMGHIMSDDEHVRWTEDELIAWFNDAASEIVLRRPGARAVNKVISLEAGSWQTSPEGVSQFLDLVRNIKADGSPGRAIRITDRQLMDSVDPDWHTAKSGVTQNYMIDERSPTRFFVYPPAVQGAKAEGLFAEPPPKVTASTDMIDIRPEFLSAILNWTMYRAHTKDSEYSQGAIATLHYQAFTDAIGVPTQAAQVNSATANSA